MLSLKSTTILKNVSKRAGRAMMDFSMLGQGDRVAVAVSGGKDSISLLHVLRDRQRIVPFKFECVAVHVDFGFSNFDSKVLVDYFEREGFPYMIKQVDAFNEQDWESIDCFWFSRNRRKALFQLAEQEGFNKIAFGHHMDDIVETILLNQFYRGEIGAMKPKQELFDGKIILIRPLAYEREENMERLADELGIRSLGQSKCANDDTSHRMLIKKMLKDFEQNNPSIVKNVFRSLQNIREEYLLDYGE